MDGLRICVYCDKEYLKRLKEKPFQYKKRKHCSIKCRMIALTKFRKPRKEFPKNERTCKQCGKTSLVPPSLSNRPFCNRVCMSLYYDDNLGGNNHWNWQGGITEIRNRDNDSPEYKQWRKAVFKRDGHRCVKCGIKKSGILRAHHILEYSRYPLFRYDVDNGKTLCENCHKEIHYGIEQQIQS